MPDKPLFELHAQLGQAENGEYYLELTLSDGTPFRNQTKYLSDAISSTAYRLKTKGYLEQLQDGTLECNPLSGSKKKKGNGGKLSRAVDLPGEFPPDCHSICLAFDIFGDTKCQNLCQQKFNKNP